MSDYPRVESELEEQSVRDEVDGLTQKQISVLILSEARRTNGRISKVERVVFGDDGEGVEGLVAITHANQKAIASATTAAKVAKYLLPFVGLGQIIQVILMLKSNG